MRGGGVVLSGGVTGGRFSRVGAGGGGDRCEMVVGIRQDTQTKDVLCK